mmetsp:Transcript_90154/g.188514  ORF Transcript_90154/g.188514 Transcript_90154/m.188514 type:complete len:124 (-) Transcript_90154:292-663(-)
MRHLAEWDVVRISPWFVSPLSQEVFRFGLFDFALDIGEVAPPIEGEEDEEAAVEEETGADLQAVFGDRFLDIAASCRATSLSPMSASTNRTFEVAFAMFAILVSLRASTVLFCFRSAASTLWL